MAQKGIHTGLKEEERKDREGDIERESLWIREEKFEYHVSITFMSIFWCVYVCGVCVQI
jgi:hypothetical protein